MKIKSIIIGIAAALCAFTAQAFTVNGISYKITNEANKQCMVVFPETGNAYSNVTSSKLTATVSYNGNTYTVLGVGAGAFQGGSISGTLVLPEGYIFIDNGGFAECKGTGVTIPASMQFITDEAFIGNQFSTINVAAGNKYFKILNTTQQNVNYPMLVNAAGNRLSAVPGAVVVSSSWFRTTYVENITIPTQITEIGDWVFNTNPTIKSITFHSGLKKIGNSACANMWLTSVTIPSPNIVLGQYLFNGCPNLTTVNLPEGLEILPKGTFMLCEGLRNITLPKTLKEIRSFAFSGTAISAINLPESLELVDSSAFQQAPLTSIDLKNVKVLGAQAFNNCANLASIKGEKVEEIGSAAFYGCTKLTQSFMPAALKTLVGSTFYRCSGITSAVVPAHLETVGRNPWVMCTNLKKFDIVDDAEHFAVLDSCLYYTENGQPYRFTAMPPARENMIVHLRPGTKAMGDQAFRLTGVTEIYAPEGLTTVETNTCLSCAQLKKVELPTTVETIESQAFGGCTALNHIQILAAVPPTLTGNEFATYETATLYVPKGSVQAYRTAPVWQQFQNIVGVDVPSPGIKGDVNGDGKVDVEDLNLLINDLLDSTVHDLKAEDMNGDGKVDVDDLNAIINIMLI